MKEEKNYLKTKVTAGSSANIGGPCSDQKTKKSKKHQNKDLLLQVHLKQTIPKDYSLSVDMKDKTKDKCLIF